MKFIAKINKFADKHEKIFRVLLIPYLGILILDALGSSFEFYNVGILKNTEGYPWGCKCFEGLEHYSSPGIYAQTMLINSLIILAIVLIALMFVKRKKSFYVLMLAPFYTLFLIITGIKIVF